ncbi:GerMN domain-containing protein [Tyzzerella sp. OttesenSCG-928-J15]|nr:GerMN domain-containing protein [Tyzzerella sp. OttesenSCG-928-J15]
MKFRKIALGAVMAAIIFTGCNNTTGNDDKEQTPSPTATASQKPVENDKNKDTSVQGTIAEFFPFKENAAYVYERSDALGLSSTYPVYIEGSKMQRATKAGEWLVTEVFENSGGELTVNYAHNSSSGFENFMGMKDEYQITVLKEPLQLGGSWETYSGPTVQGVAKGVCTITDVGVEVETPYGKVSAIEVSTELENGYTNVDYYAKGIGLVKSGYFIKGFESATSTAEDVNTDLVLKSFEENSPYEVDFLVCFPNENADGLEETAVNYEYNTNGDLQAILEEALKNPTGNPNNKVISENTKINFVDVTWQSSKDPETNAYKETAAVHVDLSHNFVDDMNAGSGYEQLLLQSLEATLKGFYNAIDFTLTIDGEAYVSRH